MIEAGRVLCPNMPAGTNPALSRAVGVLLKQAWLQTLLRRPAEMQRDPERVFRPAVFLCDEYQSFATVGENDPAGDEKAYALTRQSRLIPIVATQSISSLCAVLGQSEAWRALLQTLRTRIFLSLADDSSVQIASALCGQVSKMKASYSVSEQPSRATASLRGRRDGPPDQDRPRYGRQGPHCRDDHAQDAPRQANQNPRRHRRFAGHQTPRFVHLPVVYAHDRAHRPFVLVGHPSTHQPPGAPAGPDPRGGRSPFAARIRHIDVSAQPNHVFKAQLGRQRVEQLAVGKAPVCYHGDFHPRRQHLPQSAQHLVLVAPLIALQRRRGHRLPQQRRRAAMAGHHRQHDGVLRIGREARPIQRDDHLGAGADDVRRPVGEKGPHVDASVAQEPVDLLDAMLGQRAHGLGQTTPHGMDCQRGARQYAQGGVGQRQHSFGMQVAVVQDFYEGLWLAGSHTRSNYLDCTLCANMA